MKQSHSSLLIITGASPESYSPAGERVRQLALASKSKFSKAMVLGLHKTRKDNKQGGGGKESNVSLYTINFSRAVPYPLVVLFDPVKMLMLLAYSLILSARIKPSCILASMPPLETGISAWILAKLKRKPLLIDLRDDWESAANALLKRYFSKASVVILSIVTKKIYSTACAILAVTQTIAETVQERGVGAKVLLVPNGADTNVFGPLDQKVRKKMRQECELPLDKTVVVYSGSGISPYYRLDIALSSIKSLAKDAVREVFFVFYVYNGVDRLEKLQRKLGIPKSQLEIRNPLPRNQLANVLAACDVGLVPFDAKPYLLCARSTKIYEYLSSGLFVICSGPKGGELDVLLSSNKEFGMFVFPSVENFVKAFRFVLESGGNSLSEDLRSLRYSFISDNYDRQDVMTRAMDTLFPDVYHGLET